MQDFQTFDLVILAIVILLGLKGIINGLVKELFGLIGIVGGVFVASRYSSEIGLLIGEYIPFKNESAITVTGFIIGLGGFWAISIFLGKIFSNLTKASGLGGINAILGFLIGAGKIFSIFSIITYASSSVEIVKKNTEKFTKDSIVYPILLETGAYIVKLDPDDFSSKPQEINHKIGENVQNDTKALESDTKPEDKIKIEITPQEQKVTSNIETQVQEVEKDVNSVIESEKSVIESAQESIESELNSKIENISESVSETIEQGIENSKNLIDGAIETTKEVIETNISQTETN